MEKISMKVSPVPATNATAINKASPAWPASRGPGANRVIAPASRCIDESCSDAELFGDLLDQVDPLSMPIPADEAPWTWPAPDESSSSGGTDSSTDGANEHRQELESDMALCQGIEAKGLVADSPATASSSFGDRSVRWDADVSSSDQFTIDHPRWGLIEVDSRRSAASWDLTVRCADADTRQRLKSHEREFHDLLSRDYGATLALDLQAVGSR